MHCTRVNFALCTTFHPQASQSHTWNCIYAVSIENTAAEIYAAIIDALHYSIIHTALKSAKHQNLTNALCAMHEVVSVLYLCVDVVRCVLCVVNAQQTSPSWSEYLRQRGFSAPSANTLFPILHPAEHSSYTYKFFAMIFPILHPALQEEYVQILRHDVPQFFPDRISDDLHT